MQNGAKSSRKRVLHVLNSPGPPLLAAAGCAVRTDAEAAFEDQDSEVL